MRSPSIPVPQSQSSPSSSPQAGFKTLRRSSPDSGAWSDGSGLRGSRIEEMSCANVFASMNESLCPHPIFLLGSRPVRLSPAGSACYDLSLLDGNSVWDNVCDTMDPHHASEFFMGLLLL